MADSLQQDPQPINSSINETIDPLRSISLQQTLTTAGQRKVNLIWEYTQAFVASIVVFANMVVGAYQGIHQVSAGETSPPFPVILSSALFLVIGFYFSRTNHTAIGGVSEKPDQINVGR